MKVMHVWIGLNIIFSMAPRGICIDEINEIK
jgi:hypothetical protein